MDQARVTRHFTNSAAGVLAGLGAALLLGSAAGAQLTTPREPLLGLSAGVMCAALGLAALAVAFICTRAASPRLKLVCVLWLAANGVFYRVALYWQGVPEMRGYAGGAAAAFGLSGEVAALLLGGGLLYLFGGSAALLAWSLLDRAGDSLVKAICAQCGGHIAFPPRNLGRSVPCPHCQSSVTLRSPENLKMSCYFCKGHIEFPPHALGTKLKCPHCGMDIKLQVAERA